MSSPRRTAYRKPDNQIISDEDAETLLSAGLLSFLSDSSAISGKIRIHRRCLNRCSEEEYGHVPLPTDLPSAPGTVADDDNDTFAVIPAHLTSYETILYLGFTESMARDIWTRWVSMTGVPNEHDNEARDMQRDIDEGLITFLDIIIGTFRPKPDHASDDDSQWFASMREWGLDNPTQAAIMEPAFRYIRLSQSCKHWVRDTMETRYAGLKDIQKASRQRDMERMGGRSTISGNGGTGISSSSACGSGGDLSTASRGNGGGRSIPGQQDGHSIPGVVSLYRAHDNARLDGLFNEDGTLANIQCLLSRSRSDFSARRDWFYFTADYNVAQCYGRYCKRRAGVASVVLLRIDIPNAAIKSLAPPQILRLFSPSNEWKQLVWHSRRGNVPSFLGPHRQATLIIGTIARRPNSHYEALPSWEHIGDDLLLRVNEQGFHDQIKSPAVQYAFSDVEGDAFLREHIISNPKVVAFTSRDLNSWLGQLVDDENE
ncbi:hypothetical protein BD289DRAFT_27632 [Coniella lustricola]|uniref:Uncharacterized protein n=1 Tax=Coniella lustricola TaxID=2025994 RepID=A0A2T3A2Z6_9PEZI|nr:hypothetical protein BD289DRAFT_27632 [Coniella lustricola]